MILLIWKTEENTLLLSKKGDESIWGCQFWYMGNHANEPVDISKVMIMCLIHDIVEIDAGDTYAYDTEGKKTQRER